VGSGAKPRPKPILVHFQACRRHKNSLYYKTRHRWFDCFCVSDFSLKFRGCSNTQNTLLVTALPLYERAAIAHGVSILHWRSQDFSSGGGPVNFLLRHRICLWATLITPARAVAASLGPRTPTIPLGYTPWLQCTYDGLMFCHFEETH